MVIGPAEARTVGAMRAGASGERASSRRASRLEYVDALRVALIVLVVAHHAGQAYGPGAGGVWPVADPAKATVFGSFFSVNAAFFMGLFFLLSAFFVPASFDRKGPATFLKDRFVRLGAPLVVIPLVGGLLGLALDLRHGAAVATVVSGTTAYADAFAPGRRSPAGCAPPMVCALGHLWFVEQLLLYTVLYAAWRLLTRRRWFGAPPVPRNAAILGYAVALAAVTYVVRIHYPINRWVDVCGFLAAEVGHLPQYASLFVIGLLAARGRWLEKLPTRRGLLWLGIGVAGAALRYRRPGRPRSRLAALEYGRSVHRDRAVRRPARAVPRMRRAAPSTAAAGGPGHVRRLSRPPVLRAALAVQRADAGRPVRPQVRARDRCRRAGQLRADRPRAPAPRRARGAVSVGRALTDERDARRAGRQARRSLRAPLGAPGRDPSA